MSYLVNTSSALIDTLLSQPEGDNKPDADATRGSTTEGEYNKVVSRKQ